MPSIDSDSGQNERHRHHNASALLRLERAAVGQMTLSVRRMTFLVEHGLVEYSTLEAVLIERDERLSQLKLFLVFAHSSVPTMIIWLGKRIHQFCMEYDAFQTALEHEINRARFMLPPHAKTHPLWVGL